MSLTPRAAVITRDYQAAQQAASRSLGGADSNTHKQRMAKAALDQVAELKRNRELEIDLYKLVNDLARLKAELTEEEAEEVEVAELNSEV